MDEIKYSTQNIDKQDIKIVTKTLRNDFITQGPLVSKFEKSLSDICQNKYIVALSNASNGLIVACKVLGLKKNDIAWCSSITFLSSISCAIHLGSEFDLIDIDLQNYNLNVDLLEQKLKLAKKKNKLPKIVIVTHLGGNPIDLKKIYSLKKKYKFKIIEDASHALGSKINKKSIGSCEYSDITVFSFHPVKSITTGEGGAITFNSKTNYIKSKQLISHGIIRDKTYFKRKYNGAWDYDVFNLGFNFRLSDINCSLGYSQLQKLKKFIKIRNNIAKHYNNIFQKNENIITPYVNKNNTSSFHLYIIRIKNLTISKKKILFELMKRKNINLNFHYIPLNKFSIFRKKFKNKKFINSEKYYKEAISLPIHTKLSKQQIKYVANNLISSLKQI